MNGCTALSSVSADGMALSRSMYVLGGIGTVGARLTSDDIMKRYAVLTSMSNIMRDYSQGDKTKLLALDEKLRIEVRANVIADEDAAFVDCRSWTESIKCVSSFFYENIKCFMTHNSIVKNPMFLPVDGAIITAIQMMSAGLALKGKPNSTEVLLNPDGTIKQKRWYGPDGNAVHDRDYNHNGNMEFPHDHEWKNGERDKEHKIPDATYEFRLDPLLGTGVVTIGAIGTAIILLDDASIIGFADDVLLAPLSTVIIEGINMIFR